MNDPEVIAAILQRTRTIAVVGLSDSPMRPSHSVSRYMQEQGYRIIPVNPQLTGEVLGEPAFPTLSAIGHPVDLVNIFRRSDQVAALVDEALRLGCRALWMQEGVVDAAAALRAEAAGVDVVMDRCILKEHQRHAR